MTDSKQIKCSFCGRKKNEVDVLIAGISGHICNYCVSQAQQIVADEITEKMQESIKKTN